MKKLIVVLAVLVVIVGTLYLTRTYCADSASFVKFLESHEGLKGEQAKKTAGSYGLDGYLWVDAKDQVTGSTVATNIFGIWIKRGDIKPVG